MTHLCHVEVNDTMAPVSMTTQITTPDHHYRHLSTSCSAQMKWLAVFLDVKSLTSTLRGLLVSPLLIRPLLVKPLLVSPAAIPAVMLDKRPCTLPSVELCDMGASICCRNNVVG